MKIKFTKVIIVLFFVLQNFSLKATHLAGGSITYKCTGGNIYNVTLTIYRDCRGIPLATPPLTVIGCTNTFTVAYTGPTVIPALITPTCNGTVITACDVPAGTAPGIERHDFLYTVDLSVHPLCSDWTFFYDVGARNGAITTLNNPNGQNMRIEAHLNNTISCHDSPVFNSEPVLYLCLNQPNLQDCSVTNSCDSFSYRLINPKGLNGVKVTYNTGFDSTHFITGSIAFNQPKGILTLTPTNNNQVSVYAMLVEQYQNGIWVGSIMRDVQLYVISCANSLPTMTGINGTSQYSMTTAANKWTCFDIYSNDANAVDSTFLSWRNEIPSAFFFASTAQNQSAQFCWGPLISDTGSCSHCFTIKVRDNACPQNGSQYSRFCITVVDSGFLANVNDLSGFGGIMVSPNPLISSSTLHLNTPLKDAEVIIYDMLGKEMMRKKMSGSSMEIERGNLESGVYFVKVRSAGEKEFVQKLMVE